LLFLLYGYYAALLYSAGSVWLFPHLAVPMALLIATRCHSFGAWQKSLVLYFLFAANVHYHLLSHGLPGRAAPSGRHVPRLSLPGRGGVVSVGAPGKGGARGKNPPVAAKTRYWKPRPPPCRGVLPWGTGPRPPPKGAGAVLSPAPAERSQSR